MLKWIKIKFRDFEEQIIIFNQFPLTFKISENQLLINLRPITGVLADIDAGRPVITGKIAPACLKTATFSKNLSVVKIQNLNRSRYSKP